MNIPLLSGLRASIQTVFVTQHRSGRETRSRGVEEEGNKIEGFLFFWVAAGANLRRRAGISRNEIGVACSALWSARRKTDGGRRDKKEEGRTGCRREGSRGRRACSDGGGGGSYGATTTATAAAP
jgi:hypothetical protein